MDAVENMVLSVIIRFQQMRYMVIFRWIDQICSLQRKHQSTQVHHIHLQKLGLIYWYWLIIEHMACRLQLAAVPIIMVHIIFQKN